MNYFTSAFKFQTLFSMAGTTIEVGKNKKYLDVPLFYGNENDRKKWEGWRLHLESKFCQSAILYTCEQDKIDYIRDHSKDTAFKFIKPKANPTSANVYLTVSEMIQDLENMFGKLDKFAKSDVLLHDPKFGMVIANLKKIFDKFFARFILAIIFLDFIDWHKILNLRQILSERLWFKIADGTIYTLFSQYVSHCYQCDLDLCQTDRFSTQNRVDKSKKIGLKSNTSKSETRNPISYLVNKRYESSNLVSSFFCLGHLKARLIKEGQYFKCGK